MATNWYYRIVGEDFGPVDFDALFELARAGGLGPDDDVRSEHTDEWQSAATIVGLFPDETDASPDRQDAETAVPATQTDDLSSLLELVTDDSGGPTTRTGGSRNQWFVCVFNQELGPLDFEAVALMAEEGELAPADLVRCGADAEWIPAEQIVGLFHEPGEAAETATLSATDSTPPANDDPDRIWYYRIGDQEHGPFDFGHVMQLASGGTIEPVTQVRAGRVGAWMDAGSIVGLFPEPEASEPTAVIEEAPAPDEVPSPVNDDGESAPPRRKRTAASRSDRKKQRRKKKRQPVVEKDVEADVMDWLNDDIDQEIDEELEQRREPTPAPAPAPAPVAQTPSPPAPPPAAPTTSATSSAASAALTAAVDAASSATSGSRTFTPPPKAKRDKSRRPSFRFNFSMPDLGIDPKQLALLGVLGLVLLYLFFPFESNPAPEYFDETRAIVDRLVPLYSAKAPPGEWAPVVSEVQPRVTELAAELDKLATASNPAMQQLLAIHRDYLPPVLEGKGDTPNFVFRRVTQTLELAGKHINQEPVTSATPPPVAENAEATAAAE